MDGLDEENYRVSLFSLRGTAPVCREKKDKGAMIAQLR